MFRTLAIWLLFASAAQARVFSDGSYAVYIEDDLQDYLVSSTNFTIGESITPTTIGASSAIFKFPFAFPIYKVSVGTGMLVDTQKDILAWAAVDVSTDGQNWAQLMRLDRFFQPEDSDRFTPFFPGNFGISNYGEYMNDSTNAWVRFRSSTNRDASAVEFLRYYDPYIMRSIRVSARPETVPEPSAWGLLLVLGAAFAGWWRIPRSTGKKL